MSETSVKIEYIYLKWFAGIKTGLGRKELEVDFTKLNSKNIIIILGDNATGKSTFLSALHCLPDVTDKRSEFIIKGKEGIKIVHYIRSDDYRFKCKIVYTPTSTGHSRKGFITRISPDGEEVELNPSGLIGTYQEIVAAELGMTSAVLKLTAQNDVCKGFVDMTSSERKINMSTFLPDDEYSSKYTIADKIYKELKIRADGFVEDIGKMHPQDVLEEGIKDVTKKINSLVEKRDKCTSKISEYQTRIKVIEEDGVEDKARSLRKEIDTHSNEAMKTHSLLDKTYESSGIKNVISKDSTAERIDNILNDFIEKAKNLEIRRSIETSQISGLMLRRNSLTSRINDKENDLKDYEVNKSANELEDLLEEYKKKDEIISRSLSKVDLKTDKNGYLRGITIVKFIKDYISSLSDFEDSVIQDVCSETDSDKMTEYDILQKIKDLKSENENLMKCITGAEQSEDSASSLSNRPKECKIDSCPFIKSAIEYERLKKNIPAWTAKHNNNLEEIEYLEGKMKSIGDVEKLKSKIAYLENYISNNIDTICKLPYSEKYSSHKALLKAISTGGTILSGCDDFEYWISACEDKEDLDDIRNSQIPKIKSEIELLKTKGSFIDSMKRELAELNKEKAEVEDQIEIHQDLLSKLNDDAEYAKSVITSLSLFKSKKEEYETLYDQIIKDDEELKKLSSKLDEIGEYRAKISEKKDQLEDIDNELNPLTRQRELYKSEQIQLARTKDNLAVVQQELVKCGFVRSALSIKDDGLPVASLEWYMDKIRQTANSLLSQAFNGSLYLEEFIIDTKEFTVPYRKNSELGMDVSSASSSERSFISLCFTMAIIEEIAGRYGIVCLDEVDKGHSTVTKPIFIKILFNAAERANIQQMFMITHNGASYKGYNNIGYITFPGADTDKDINDENSIEITREE